MKPRVSGCWDVKSLEPLRGMRLTEFSCDNTQVEDLSPLIKMPLTRLICPVTRVADLSPLKGMPLEELLIDQPQVKDLSPLAGMKLKRVSFSPAPDLQGLQILRQMDSLTEIGTAYNATFLPRQEFWKKFDEGAFGPR